jgi:hypothetical protein
MRRREFIAGLGGAAAWPLGAIAQPPGKLPTIGFLGADAAVFSPWTAAFVARLRELGWVEGHTIAIEYRWSQGRTQKGGGNGCCYPTSGAAIAAGLPWLTGARGQRARNLAGPAVCVALSFNIDAPSQVANSAERPAGVIAGCRPAHGQHRGNYMVGT